MGVGQRTEITSVEHVAVRANTAPDTLQRWGTPLVALLAWAGMTGGGLLLYQVLDSAVKGAPFVHDNVRRLRRLALIAVGGAVATYVAPLVLDPEPLADLPEGVGTAIPIPFLSWFGLLAVAAVSAVLAAVFERGCSSPMPRRARSDDAPADDEDPVGSLVIVVRLDELLAERGRTLTWLSEEVGITMANLSILKTGKARAIRFTTLALLCEALECTPGDLLGVAPR